MEERIDIAAPDALWLSALIRDRVRAELRLGQCMAGRTMQEAAAIAGRLVHAELDREERWRAKQPVQRDDWIRRILVARDRRLKRRAPATRRRWAIMMQPRPCVWEPPPWWGMLSGREPPPYDAGEDWGALCLP